MLKYFKSALNYIKENRGIQVIILVIILLIIYNIRFVSETLDNVSNIDDKKALVQGQEEGDYSEVNTNEIDEAIPKISTEDLLPKYDDANEFAQQNPVSKLLKEQNFLISGYHVGINSSLQSNKIPYLDIRSLPIIPKESAGPWNQSTVEQSPLRKGFELV